MSQINLPVLSRTTPPADLLKPTNYKFRRTNARIHSSNFYQSLKSRWKSDLSTAEDTSGSNSKLNLTSAFPAQTDPNLETKLPEQQKYSSLTTDLHGGHPSAEGSVLPQAVDSLSPRLATPTNQIDLHVEGNGTIAPAAGISQSDPITSSPNSPAPTTTSSPVQPRSAVVNHTDSIAAQRCKSAPLVSAQQHSPVCLSPSLITDGAFRGVIQAEFKPPPPPVHEGSSPTSRHDSVELLGSPADLPAPIQLPDIPQGCSKSDLLPHVKPSHMQKLLSQENQSNQTHQLICPQKPASTVSNEPLAMEGKPLGRSKPNSTASSRPQRVAGVPLHFATTNQVDESIPDTVKLETDVVEGLLHKNHSNFASRRSSISMVLKRPDSIDASTPLLFQGIWEKELEENERKWKRLARMSGSQPSPIYSSELHPDKDGVTKQQDACTLANQDCLMRRSKKSGHNFSRPGAVQACTIRSQNDALEGSQDQPDVLDQIWDSFRSEAEISLSDINFDEPLVDHFANSVGELGGPAEASPLLQPVEQPSSCFTGPEPPASFSAKVENPIGLGLFHSSDPSPQSSSPTSNDFSPITSPKLKKLSLLSNHPIYSSLLGSSRGKRRPTVSKPPYNVERTPNLKVNSSPLDLSLLKDFPAPPSKYQTNQPSSASFSLKPLKLPDSPRRSQAIPATSPVTPVPESTSKLPSNDTASGKRNAPVSTLKSSASKPLSFTLTSFSNRPRAQTSGRSPVPPPLKLRAPSPLLNSDHRRQVFTADFHNNGHSGTAAAPPVPLLQAPNTAPLQSSWSTFESNNRERNSEPVPSSGHVRPIESSATVNSKLSTCGLTPKRPSLVMRRGLRSPRIAAGAWRRETQVPPSHPASTDTSILASPKACSPFSTTRAVGQDTSTSLVHFPTEQAGCFTSPQTSIGSSTTTASSGSTIPSPTTPTSTRMTYNSRLPSVPMYHSSHCSPSSLSPIQSINPDILRYVIIEQTPKSSNSERATPNTIKASRPLRPDCLKAKPSPEPMEQVSYGMAL